MFPGSRISEESFFRGLIPNFLRPRGIRAVVILSSIFFALGHLANILAGKNPLLTILQVLFALSFGVLAISIRILTDSLVIPIAWYAGHNFLSWISIEGDFKLNFIFASLQIIVYLAYSYYLWKSHEEHINF